MRGVTKRYGGMMIARLSGTLAEMTADGAVIDVGGVGYQVHCSARTLDALGPVGGEVLILTELQVREDAWTLFGFGSAVERDTFRALTSVQGVGGKVALAILSALSPDELARAVAQDDKAMIGRANGVGPKLAARIANELQGKLGVVGLAGGAPAPRAGAAADALSALANLGFKPAEASAAVNAAQDELGPDAESRRARATGVEEGGEVITRTASCRCGQLKATAIGEPVRISVCHCLDCKKRSGSAFAVQARWPAEQVTIEGSSKSWVNVADSGNRITFDFCPECGSDVHYEIDGKFGGLVAIPLGAFDDPYFCDARITPSGNGASTTGSRSSGERRAHRLSVSTAPDVAVDRRSCGPSVSPAGSWLQPRFQIARQAAGSGRAGL